MCPPLGPGSGSKSGWRSGSSSSHVSLPACRRLSPFPFSCPPFFVVRGLSVLNAVLSNRTSRDGIIPPLLPGTSHCIATSASSLTACISASARLSYCPGESQSGGSACPVSLHSRACHHRSGPSTGTYQTHHRPAPRPCWRAASCRFLCASVSSCRPPPGRPASSAHRCARG